MYPSLSLWNWVAWKWYWDKLIVLPSFGKRDGHNIRISIFVIITTDGCCHGITDHDPVTTLRPGHHPPVARHRGHAALPSHILFIGKHGCREKPFEYVHCVDDKSLRWHVTWRLYAGNWRDLHTIHTAICLHNYHLQYWNHSFGNKNRAKQNR